MSGHLERPGSGPRIGMGSFLEKGLKYKRTAHIREAVRRTIESGGEKGPRAGEYYQFSPRISKWA